MLKRQVAALLCVVGVVTFTACSSNPSSTSASSKKEVPAAFADREASGEQLANAWFGLLSLTGREKGDVAQSQEEVKKSMALVQPYLDPAFTLVRSTGQRYTASNYVPLDVDDYEVSDVVVTEPRDDIRVIRYFVSAPGATAPDSGVVMSDAKAPRISVMRWDAQREHWVIVSHANFNTPVAAICDQAPIEMTGETPAANQADVELGTSLIEQWRDITMGKSKEKIRHAANQIQLADGRGWPAADGKAIEWAPAAAYDFEEVGVARNGDLLVASYDAVASDLVMEGNEYRDQATPRLLTYLQNAEGKWELIALANFAVPQKVPADVDCVSLSSGS